MKILFIFSTFKNVFKKANSLNSENIENIENIDNVTKAVDSSKIIYTNNIHKYSENFQRFKTI
jgi:hypothetical protein